MIALAERFARDELALDPRLVEMLADHPSHCTERRGCGFTQASRYLAESVNAPRSPTDAGDLRLFDAWPMRATERIAREACIHGWPHGWRALDRAPAIGTDGAEEALAALRTLGPRLSAIHAEQTSSGASMLCAIIRDLLGPGVEARIVLPEMALKPKIGSCSMAEEYFLEIAHGRVRRGGRVNVFVDASSRPVLIEKIGLGESHSALSLVEIAINGVRLPPGSLLAIDHVPVAPTPPEHAHGGLLPADRIARARFLRLTTLCVPPPERRSCFTTQVDLQLRANMLSPLTTTLDDLRGFAARACESAH